MPESATEYYKKVASHLFSSLGWPCGYRIVFLGSFFGVFFLGGRRFFGQFWAILGNLGRFFGGRPISLSLNTGFGSGYVLVSLRAYASAGRLCARFTARIRLRRSAMCSFHCAHTPPIARAAVYCRSKIETADRFRLARNHSIVVLQNYDINVIYADKMERVHAEWRKIWMNDAPMATQSSKPAIDRATMAFWSCATMSSGVASVMPDVRRE